MASKISFSVEPRTVLGKKVKLLRQELLTPGNVYGVGEESRALQFVATEFNKLYEQVGETGVVYLSVGNEDTEVPVLVDEVQLDPVTGEYLHVSFKQVDLTQKIEAEIPVEIVGEFDVPEAVMVQVRNTIEVEALPADLPEKFEVDISILEEIGQMITLNDLDFDKKKVTIVDVESEEDWEKPVVLVQEQREEEEEEEVSPDEVELVGEEDAEAAGEAGAESAEAAPEAEPEDEAADE